MTNQEAIEELKQYRACSGTCFPAEIAIAISALEEIQQYRAIGTVGECREATEKQRAYRPIKLIDCVYGCKCGNKVTECFQYCDMCGQRLDWGEEE